MHVCIYVYCGHCTVCMYVYMSIVVTVQYACMYICLLWSLYSMHVCIYVYCGHCTVCMYVYIHVRVSRSPWYKTHNYSTRNPRVLCNIHGNSPSCSCLYNYFIKHSVSCYIYYMQSLLGWPLQTCSPLPIGINALTMYCWSAELALRRWTIRPITHCSSAKSSGSRWVGMCVWGGNMACTHTEATCNERPELISCMCTFTYVLDIAVHLTRVACEY